MKCKIISIVYSRNHFVIYDQIYEKQVLYISISPMIVFGFRRSGHICISYRKSRFFLQSVLVSSNYCLLPRTLAITQPYKYGQHLT